MSWDSYIANLLSKPFMKDAAICGIEPVSVWAQSPNFHLKPDEVKKLAGDRSSFRQCGPHIGEMKCMVIRDQLDEDGMHSMNLKTSADPEGNTYNICVGKSHKALVIGIGKKDAQAGQVSMEVSKIVDYLRKSNY